MNPLVRHPASPTLPALIAAAGDQADMRFLEFLDRKSTRLNSSHANISYAVFCLKKKTKTHFFYFSLLIAYTFNPFFYQLFSSLYSSSLSSTPISYHRRTYILLMPSPCPPIYPFV